MNNPEITMIQLSKIHVSAMNPRKFQNTGSIDELAESIRSIGLLQPVTIRKGIRKGTFEIVAGERRFKAFKQIGMPEMPCIIKTLTDEQALEVMITENLQREDIHPLEESEAFHRLISPICNLYDIAARFGKSITYVKGRIKLNDLNAEFRELLWKEVINISVALEIACMKPEAQRDIYDRFYERNDGQYWNAPSLIAIQNYITSHLSAKLSEVCFDIQDAELIPSAGSCMACINNSAARFSLFPEELKTGLCLHLSCLKSKEAKHFENQVKSIIDLEPETFVGTDGYIREDDKQLIEELTNQEVKIFEFGYATGYAKIHEPKLPKAPVADDFEGGTEDEDYLEQHESYHQDIEEYQKEKTEYEQHIQSDDVSRVFMLSGNRKGEFCYFKPNGNVPVNTSGEPHSKDKSDRIRVLQDKLKRNGELAFEKIYFLVRDMMKESEYPSMDKPISVLETRAFFYNITSHHLAMDLNLSQLDDFKVLSEIPMILFDKTSMQIFRSWLLGELYTGIPISEKNKAQNLIGISMENYPETTSNIMDAVKVKYVKRNESIEAKIAEITVTN